MESSVIFTKNAQSLPVREVYMDNDQFWNRVVGITVGVVLAVALFLTWSVYPAFIHHVKSIDAVKWALTERPDILITEFAELAVSDKSYTVHLDGRNRLANEVGYSVRGNYPFLGTTARLSLNCLPRHESYEGNLGKYTFTYRGISIGISHYSSAVFAMTLLGDSMYEYGLVLSIRNAISEQRPAGADIIITLTERLVNLYFETQ